jgi:hypothetical protein
METISMFLSDKKQSTLHLDGKTVNPVNPRNSERSFSSASIGNCIESLLGSKHELQNPKIPDLTVVIHREYNKPPAILL